MNVESKLSRRNVLQFGSAAAVTGCATPALVDVGIAKATSLGLVDYLKSSPEGWSIHSFANWIGAANAFKEGDAIIGVAAKDDEHRKVARMLLANTRLYQIDANPIFSDDLHRAIISSIDETVAATLRDWTLGALRHYLLAKEEADIKAIMPGLSSDVIGCVVKLLSDEELTAIASKIFNPLPGSNIGERGYLGARIQPNSPTDNIDDIAWQVFNGFAYGVGDVVIGTNPVSSEPESVHAIEVALKDIVDTFGLSDVLPHCVLAHIDVQAEVEKKWPSSTALWFQSIAGSDAANKTFDLSLDRLVAHADQRQGKFAMYFETGQGADFTNGHGQSMDMVLHESRKYGLARFLSLRIAAANGRRPWLHVNDVAGFIGPEVFRNRDQLVRCCLEDLVMGKLHGLCIGLDVCSTLHMDVSLDDLDYCLERVAPANPAYLMALPTKIDPMLGYLTTGFQDHVRLRRKFDFKISEPMHHFFRKLAVVDDTGAPAENFGKPEQIYVEYRRRKGDNRPERDILAEAEQKMDAVRGRGLFLAQGHGELPEDLEPAIAQEIHTIYERSRKSIWADFDAAFLPSLADVIIAETKARDRRDYILHPELGETPSEATVAQLTEWRGRGAGSFDIQIVLSDGLNAIAIMDDPVRNSFLQALARGLKQNGLSVAPNIIAFERGRVRAGYKAGEILFSGSSGRKAIIHVIGERPGSGHDCFSAYMTVADGQLWSQSGGVDHDVTRVVSGISATALAPDIGARDCTRIFLEMWQKAGAR